MKLLELSGLIQLWDQDKDDFRNSLRRDAKGTIESLGFEVTPVEVEAIARIDWTLSDEQLEVVLTHQP